MAVRLAIQKGMRNTGSSSGRPPEDRRALRREILWLAAPAAAEQLLASLTQMVDTALVGPLGPVAVAAVGLSTQPLWFLMSPFIGIGAGLGALVARAVGAGDAQEAGDAVRQGILLGSALALAVAAGLWTGAPGLLRWLGAEAAVIPVAVAYLRALVPGLAALFLSLILGSAFRAAGDTRSPFRISLVANGLNLVLAWAWIYGHLGLPAWGVVGAGWATTVARLAALGLMLAVLFRGRGPLALPLRGVVRVNPGLILRILRVGVPAAVNRLLGSGAYLVYLRLVAGLGTVTMAAHYTAVVAEELSWIVASGISVAVAALVGQALGARTPHRARLAIAEAIYLGGGMMAAIGLFYLAVPEWYLRIFTQDPAVLALAATALRVTAAGQIPMVLSEVLQGALAGAGDTRVLVWIAAFGGWVVRLGAAYYFVAVLDWGLAGAWAGAVLDWVARLVLMLIRVRSGRWQEVQV